MAIFVKLLRSFSNRRAGDLIAKSDALWLSDDKNYSLKEIRFVPWNPKE